jgi:hypothetical protein
MSKKGIIDRLAATLLNQEHILAEIPALMREKALALAKWKSARDAESAGDYPDGTVPLVLIGTDPDAMCAEISAFEKRF